MSLAELSKVASFFEMCQSSRCAAKCKSKRDFMPRLHHVNAVSCNNVSPRNSAILTLTKDICYLKGLPRSRYFAESQCAI